MRIGQEAKSSAHFVSLDDKKAYVFYCSCDAFILAFSEKFEYADDMKKAIEDKDIDEIASIIASCEEYVKGVDNYQKFVETELQKHVEAMMLDVEYIDDLENEFEEVEVYYI